MFFLGGEGGVVRIQSYSQTNVCCRMVAEGAKRYTKVVLVAVLRGLCRKQNRNMMSDW